MKFLAFLKNSLDNLNMAKTKTKKEEKEEVTKSEYKIELQETTGTVDLLNPAFDPEIPEQKQRHFR